MRNPWSRYRAYLKRKAFPLDGLALVTEMRTQLLPSVLPPFAVLGVCRLLGASDGVERWLMLGSLCMSTAAFVLVVWEFFLSPLRDDFVEARARAKRHRD